MEVVLVDAHQLHGMKARVTGPTGVLHDALRAVCQQLLKLAALHPPLLHGFPFSCANRSCSNFSRASAIHAAWAGWTFGMTHWTCPNQKAANSGVPKRGLRGCRCAATPDHTLTRTNAVATTLTPASFVMTPPPP